MGIFPSSFEILKVFSFNPMFESVTSFCISNIIIDTIPNICSHKGKTIFPVKFWIIHPVAYIDRDDRRGGRISLNPKYGVNLWHGGLLENLGYGGLLEALGCRNSKFVARGPLACIVFATS